jgi:hypothetical protein
MADDRDDKKGFAEKRLEKQGSARQPTPAPSFA